MKKYLLSCIVMLTVSASLCAQNNMKTISANSAQLNLASLDDTSVNTVITRHFLAGYNTLCLPFSMGGDQLASSVKDLRVERLAAIGQEGTTLCLYFIDCTDEGIEAGMPYLVFSPTMQNMRAQSKDASYVGVSPISVRMTDDLGNAVVFSSSWNSIQEVGRYGIPAQQDVTPLESVLVRTQGDKTFLPTRCGFVWEQQGATAQNLEIRHIKSLDEATAIQSTSLAAGIVDVYDVKGMMVKKQAN